MVLSKVYCKTNPHGPFDTYPLYRLDGTDFSNLMEAAREAENQFGSDWLEVKMGTESLCRLDFLRSYAILV